MSKFINTRALISILIIFCLIVGLFMTIRSCGHEQVVNATVSSNDIFLGDIITYEDKTSGSESWMWEFGNGDYSVSRSGTYTFSEIGNYQIRLKIDNQLEKTFLIRVRQSPENINKQHLIRISAPSTAMQGEYILFSATGSDQDWRWEFGESGLVDSREKTPIYAYQNHGTFEVKLHTEKTQYPIIHKITVLPKYTEGDTTDVMTIVGDDIKEKLQNIADGKKFNSNYNHILQTYLHNNPDILVTVNNTHRNDFYSYCQGLRLVGKGTSIETVFVEASSTDSNRITHIMVLQYAPGEVATKTNAAKQ